MICDTLNDEVKSIFYNNYKVYYIGYVLLDEDNIKNIDNLTTCYAVTCNKHNDITLVITWLSVHFNHRGCGFGTRLLNHIINNCDKCVKFIELDDMSENAWNLNNNIYLKHGFKYKNSYPSPEMILIIDDHKCDNSFINLFESIKLT